MRAIPNAAVEIVAKWEGFEPKAYLCPAKVWTIGYGHTANVKPGDTVTEQQARDFLRADLEVAREKIYRWVHREVIDSLTENQYAALISFAYNVGLKPTWGLVNALNGRNLSAVTAQMRRFNKAGGKVLQGLVNRRADEAMLWDRP